MLGKSIFDIIDLVKDPPCVVEAKLQAYKNEISVYQIQAFNDGNQELLDELKENEKMVDKVLADLKRGVYLSSQPAE